MTKRKTKDARTAAQVETDFDPIMGAEDLKAIRGSTRMMAVSRRMRFDGWKCSWCRDPVPLHRRADAQFCGESCRK